MEKKRNSFIIPLYCFGIIAVFAAVLIIPAARAWFEGATAEHPFIMGFFKFAFLALSGELIAIRIKGKLWSLPSYVIARFALWGLIGVWITFMMKVFSSGIGALIEKNIIIGSGSKFLKALFTSATMNLTFGPTFMAVHKCSDRVLDMIKIKEKVCIESVIGSINWSAFVRFTLIKTVPLFWIPAHTVTFLLPEAYQVVLAAFLSVALGIILSFGTKKRSV